MNIKTAFTVFAGLTLLAFSASAQTLANYRATVLSQGPSNYFTLDNTLSDAVNGSQFLTASGPGVSPLPDAYGNVAFSYAFLNDNDYIGLSPDTDIIKGGGITNTAATGTGSISLLFRALDGTNGGRRYLFAQGDVTTNGNALALFFESISTNNTGDDNDLELRVGGNTTSILLSNDIVRSSWYYFAMTWDESRDAGEVIWYLGRLGGTLNSGTNDIGNEDVVGDNSSFVLGNEAASPTAGGGFRNPGRGRLDEFAVWQTELTESQIAAQFANVPNYYPDCGSYQQVITAQFPAFYFRLNNSLSNSIIGSNLTLLASGDSGTFFTNDILDNANSAYAYAATNDVLITSNDIVSGGGIADAAAMGVGSISCLFRTLDDTNNTGQRFIFSQGAGVSGTGNQFAFFFENNNLANGDPNSLKLRVGNGPTTTLIQASNLMTNAWYYFAMAYNEARNNNPGEVQWFIGPVGGALTRGAIDINNTAVVGDNGPLCIGNKFEATLPLGAFKSAFRTPGRGQIDEFVIWNDELSPPEVQAQFDALYLSRPVLNIVRQGGNVILSWPNTTPSCFGLESTTTLRLPSWASAGTPVVVGSNYVVTNSISAQAYYRLKR